jgi:hypothetical protein
LDESPNRRIAAEVSVVELTGPSDKDAMSWIENRFEEGVMVSSLDWAINWGQQHPADDLWADLFRDRGRLKTAAKREIE